MRSNSLLLRRFALYKDVPVSRSTGRARATNAARRKRQRAIQVVATHPAGELSKTIKQDIDQNVNTSSKRSTADSRFMPSSEIIFFSEMTPRYKYRERYFMAGRPRPTCCQSTTNFGGTDSGKISFDWRNAFKNLARKTVARLNSLKRY